MRNLSGSRFKTGVKQGDAISGLIFLVVADWIMRNTTAGNKTGIRWNFTSKQEDLDIADDISLMSSCYKHANTDKTTESMCSKDMTKNK